MKKICVVTGTRAEYGLLKPLLERIQDDSTCQLQLVVTGMHLSPEFGLTCKVIEEDGFPVLERNEMLLSSDTPNGITKSVGVGIIGFADIFTRNKPDIVVLLGDRYEIFAAASAAMIHRIPIAHIHGGERTEGMIDEAIRHSVTKMSILHFASAKQYQKRIIQLGESPDRVFWVGALGVENIRKQKLLERQELEKSIQFRLDKPYFIVTYHPVTLEDNTAGIQFGNLLNALEQLPGYKVIFTKANSDTDGRIINEQIEKYVAQHEDTIVFSSLGTIRYLSALKHCAMVIGNSSSGLIEAPSFHIPTVNIGDRQKGRIRAESVFDCGWKADAILDAVQKAKKWKAQNGSKEVQNPYEREGTSRMILEEIKKYLNSGAALQKKFYDMEVR